MKRYLFLLLISFPMVLAGQQSINPIVKAENDFEKTCQQKGIKTGFLDYLDSTAVAFTEKGIVNALQFWKSLSDFPGYYSWAPSYAEVSIDGKWGYTTGSVEYREKSPMDTPAYYSQYTTIWHKNDAGQWKYLVDIGNSHALRKIDRTAEEVQVPKFGSHITENDIQDLEKEYIAKIKALGLEGVRDYYGEHYILNMNGHFPVAHKEEGLEILGYLKDLEYTPRGIKTAPSGDMAVTYGNTVYQGKSNYYVRVWRHEKSGWKIALEVIKI